MVISINTKKLLIALLILGSVAGGFWFFKSTSSTTTNSNYSLLNKAVTANIGKHFIINFKPLRIELEKIQKKYLQKTYIYFSYLNNGAWVGLNERELFTAASTIKVPLAMAIYKAVEGGKLKTGDQYSLEEINLDDNFGNLYQVGPDRMFSIEELIKIMLEQSDNTAANALMTVLGRIGIDNPFAEIYAAMGWDNYPSIGMPITFNDINLKTLSNMFLALYNATYVNTEHSEQILKYLSNTPFNDKIVARIPEGIVVSHKIGVAVNAETFSDCGIVYAPNRHYILCLGSNGGNEKRAAQFMAEVSAAVYKFVINN